MIQIKKNERDIEPAAYEVALHARYRVWMLAPQASGARLVEYEMDQEAIEEFLEDYTRFADLLVRVEALEGSADVHTAKLEE